MHDQGSEFIVCEFIRSPIEKYYGIIANPSSSWNPTSNAILERIHSILGNLVWAYNIKHTYIDKDFLWSGILADALLSICSTEKRVKSLYSGPIGIWP